MKTQTSQTFDTEDHDREKEEVHIESEEIKAVRSIWIVSDFILYDHDGCNRLVHVNAVWYQSSSKSVFVY